VVEDTLANTESGDEALEKHPEIELAVRIEGHARHYSQHAAGMIITESPTTTHVAVDRRTGSTMCDKRGAEDLGLLKIDALGLIQLSVIEDCLDMMGQPREWLFNLPLSDPAAFRVLNECRFAGIFQFQGQALQNLTKQIKVSSFNDIASLTALARPGPLMSGAAADWVERKNGKKAVPVVSEKLTDILSETYGVLAYQEQLMRIAREIGGLDWPAVSSLRKAVSKSLGTDAMNKFREQFIPGAIESGLEPDMAERLWDGMCQHGAYSFNKSHSVAYSVISYWCCLLKYMDPVKFACASIRRESSDEAVINMLREVREEGILHIPFDKDLSGTQWEVHDGKLLGPLTGVKGVGPKIAEAMVEWRANGEDMPERYVTILETAQTPWDDLYPIRSKFREFFDDPIKNNILSPLVTSADITDQEPNWAERVMIGTISETTTRDHNESSLVERRGNKMSGKTQFLSFVISDDNGTIPAQVRRGDFDTTGKRIIEEGNLSNAVWVFSGSVNTGFKRLNVKRARLLGYLDEGKIVDGKE
jgi:DNA polymerase III alpha subunit